LRRKPSTNSAILTSIPNGQALTVLGVVNGWYVVRYGSLTGYVVSGFVTLG